MIAFTFGKGFTNPLKCIGRILKRKRTSLIARRWNDDETEITLENRILMAQSGPNPILVFHNEFVQPSFLGRRSPCVHRTHSFLLYIYTDHIKTSAGPTSGHRGAELSQTNHRDISNHGHHPLRFEIIVYYYKSLSQERQSEVVDDRTRR